MSKHPGLFLPGASFVHIQNLPLLVSQKEIVGIAVSWKIEDRIVVVEMDIPVGFLHGPDLEDVLREITVPVIDLDLIKIIPGRSKPYIEMILVFRIGIRNGGLMMKCMDIDHVALSSSRMLSIGLKHLSVKKGVIVKNTITPYGLFYSPSVDCLFTMS
jgi:hypothetical protein